MDADERAEALDLAREALGWRLPARRWVQVDRAVQALAEALAQRDDVAFRRNARELALSGPGRAADPDDPPRELASPPTRERLARLVHTLDGKNSDPSPDDTSAAG
ncbi:CATRA system-associated protein [Pseudonocardia oroxyli]|uniref:CATRA system-associated protein n=1 Tax=Pseudonocardia oroxyli TaxID=366584 RepID=UPI000B8780A6|nr:CATRA system-associated protein [Pseudonocardia oroxyli]